MTDPTRPPHPAVAQVLRWFDSAHLPPDLAAVVGDCRMLAEKMAEAYPDDEPNLMAGLWTLVRAKDSFVRAAIVHREAGDARVRAEFEASRAAPDG
jgi:hypothetical protein